jgi:hypothetical protein
MPDRPNRPSNASAPLTIVIMPGASLLDIRSLAEGVALVRCPGCCATMVLTSRWGGGASHMAFVHEDPDCPVLARIEAALAGLRAARNGETN